MIYLPNTSFASVTLYEIEIRNRNSVVKVERKDEDYICHEEKLPLIFRILLKRVCFSHSIVVKLESLWF